MLARQLVDVQRPCESALCIDSHPSHGELPAHFPPTMKIRSLLAILLTATAFAADDAETLTPIFNGKDLAGWAPVNIAPGTFSVRDGLLITTVHPIGVIRTERLY